MAWWLAYEELYGDMDKEYPIMSEKFKDDVTILGGEETVSADRSQTGNFLAADTVSLDFDSLTFSGEGKDHIDFSGFAGTAYDDPKYFAYDFGDDPYPTVGSVDDVYKFHFPGTETTKPQPDLTSQATQKYGEDKGIADLKDYVSSTYSGHYTSRNNNVQTLDLIQSVGDAESFCRSNAIKYLSRYDKKGQAKRDILKAMHYCLLLYYFSGQTNETPTRGYETF